MSNPAQYVSPTLYGQYQFDIEGGKPQRVCLQQTAVRCTNVP